MHLQEGSNFLFYPSFSLSTICYMLAAMMLPNQNSRTLSEFVLMLNFLDLHNGSCKCIAINRKTQPAHLINIVMFSTLLCNITMPIPNSLNVQLHSHLTSPSAKTTNQSLIMTSKHILKNNANAFPSALLCVRH